MTAEAEVPQKTPEQQARSDRAKAAWAKKREKEAKKVARAEARQAKKAALEANTLNTNEAVLHTPIKDMSNSRTGVSMNVTVPPNTNHIPISNDQHQWQANHPWESVDTTKKAPITHQIHFVEDGLTALGRMFYRGEELTITEGTKEWEQTLNKHGESWVLLKSDYVAQIKKWGKEMFKPGPWPFEKHTAMTEDDYQRALSTNDQEAINKYEKSSQRVKPPAISGSSPKAKATPW